MLSQRLLRATELRRRERSACLLCEPVQGWRATGHNATWCGLQRTMPEDDNSNTNSGSDFFEQLTNGKAAPKESNGTILFWKQTVLFLRVF